MGTNLERGLRRAFSLVGPGVLLLLALCSGSAQLRPAEAGVQTVETLQRWLESGDPRLIAWAAHHIGSDVAVTSPAMPRLRAHLLYLVDLYQPLSTWEGPVSASQLNQREWEGSRAMLMVLNTLQRTGASISPEVALRLYPEFGTVALVLLSNACRSDASGCEAVWMKVLQSTASLEDRVAAADMLAAKPPAGYVAALLRRVYFQVDVTVSPDGKSMGLGWGSSIGDCWGTGPAPEWPQESKLYGSLKPSEKSAAPWVTGPVPVYLTAGGCGPGVPGRLYPTLAEVWEPESKVMWRLTTSALHRDEKEMPVSLRTAVALQWKDNNRFRANVDATYLRVRTGIDDLLKLLIGEGLLTQDEASELLRADHPEFLQLRFGMFDERPEDEQQNPLPAVRFHDPHVVWGAPTSSPWVWSAY